MTYSHMANATLPSAMCRFTSEFGMGSGGSNTLLSSGKPVGLAANWVASHAFQRVKPIWTEVAFTQVRGQSPTLHL